MCDFEILFQFFDELPLSEQNSPKWDAALCGVTSGAKLRMPMSHKKDARLISIIFYFIFYNILISALKWVKKSKRDLPI